MSGLSRIFTVVDDVPTITPVGINLPCFKKLYLADKSEDKSLYASQLAFIYHNVAYRSPYYDVKGKMEVIAEKFLGKKNFKISSLLQECLDECIEKESTPEIRALDSAISLCDSVSDLSSNLHNEKKQFDKLLDEIDAEIKNSSEIKDKIELMKAKQALQKSAVDMANTAVSIIKNLKAAVTDLTKLRENAVKSLLEAEASGKGLETFMIDEFLQKY